MSEPNEPLVYDGQPYENIIEAMIAMARLANEQGRPVTTCFNGQTIIVRPQDNPQVLAQRYLDRIDDTPQYTPQERSERIQQHLLELEQIDLSDPEVVLHWLYNLWRFWGDGKGVPDNAALAVTRKIGREGGYLPNDPEKRRTPPNSRPQLATWTIGLALEWLIEPDPTIRPPLFGAMFEMWNIVP